VDLINNYVRHATQHRIVLQSTQQDARRAKQQLRVL
jgi:hypothetical protein